MIRAIVLVLLLGGCSVRYVFPPSPGEEACASQANDDPAVKEQLAIAAGKLDYQWKHEEEMRQVRQDAITRCLRARGLAPRGGVERPR